MIATSYPLLDAFLTMLWVFLFIVWVWLLIVIFGDIFRSHDLSGLSKGLWVLGVVIFPLLGVLFYLITRGSRMHERQAAAARAQEEAFREFVRQAAAHDGGSSADELAKLADLRDKGVISDTELQHLKARMLTE